MSETVVAKFFDGEGKVTARIIRKPDTRAIPEIDEDTRRLLLSLKKNLRQRSAVEVKILVEKFIDTMIGP